MSPLPEGLRPMLAVTTTAPPADTGGWAAEVKWDGYRALCLRDDDGMRLHSRRGNDMVGWFPELGGLHHALSGHEVVLDGEVVAIGSDGGPAFELLQQRMHRRPTTQGRRPPDTAPVVYLVFDLLWLDGRLVTGLPLVERRGLLEGRRSTDWRKLLNYHHDVFVVGG
jgi:bifunctional non-homologous end joining protein LigD